MQRFPVFWLPLVFQRLFLCSCQSGFYGTACWIGKAMASTTNRRFFAFCGLRKHTLIPPVGIVHLALLWILLDEDCITNFSILSGGLGDFGKAPRFYDILRWVLGEEKKTKFLWRGKRRRIIGTTCNNNDTLHDTRWWMLLWKHSCDGFNRHVLTFYS